MSHRKALSQWEQQVSTHLGHLSRPQAHVLALWSYGMVLAKSCGITSVAAVLAQGLGSSLGTALATIARVVLRWGGQKGSPSARAGCHALFGTRASVGSSRSGRLGNAVWQMADGCDDADGPLSRPVCERALPRLRDPGGVEAATQRPERGLGTVLEGVVYLSARQRAQGMDRDRAGRSRLVCPVVVSSPRLVGLASVPAHQAFEAKSVRWAQSASTGFRAWCPSREPLGVGWWIASSRRRCAVRGSPAGRKATPMPGWW